MKQLWLFVTGLILTQFSFAQFSREDVHKASGYFREAKDIADRDRGRLWRNYLYGPMIFINPWTKLAIANEKDSSGTFKNEGDVFVGKVPSDFGVANTAKYWQGKIWTVIQWPLPQSKTERQNLMLHELYHRLQKIVSLPGSDANCEHLDRYQGRLLLRLEMEALKKVILAYPRFDKKDLGNAISIRAYRYQVFPQADSLERRLEQNEGLAEFTGLILSGRTETQMKEHLLTVIDSFSKAQSFVRSMAYITGAVYGFLLSTKNINWNKVFLDRKEDFVKLSLLNLVTKEFNLTISDYLDKLIDKIEKDNLYSYAKIYAEEQAREDKRLKVFAENKARLVDGPVIILPNAHMNFVFNPNEVQMLEGYGPVYPTFSCKADWGTLEVQRGGALVKDWMYVHIAMNNAANMTSSDIDGLDWKIHLNNGWVIRPGKRKGDWEVVKQ